MTFASRVSKPIFVTAARWAGSLSQCPLPGRRRTDEIAADIAQAAATMADWTCPSRPLHLLQTFAAVTGVYGRRLRPPPRPLAGSAAASRRLGKSGRSGILTAGRANREVPGPRP